MKPLVSSSSSEVFWSRDPAGPLRRALAAMAAPPFFDFFFFRLLCTTGVLFVFAVGRQALAWPSAKAWPLLVLVGTVDVVVSRTLYYVALRRLRLSILSVVLTLSPVVAVGWSLLLFDTFPTRQQLLGGVAVILGVLVVTIKQARQTTDIAPAG